jgi:hypothetical protein
VHVDVTYVLRARQDLMEMFIQYQIPSDLMSFDGDVNLSVRYVFWCDRVRVVCRRHVERACIFLS